MGLDPLPELNDAYEKLVVSGSRPSALLTVALCHACLDSILAYHNQPPPHTDDDESKRLPPPPRSLTEVLRLAQGVVQEHPGRRDVWICLARTYAAMRIPDRALAALNLMPAPPDDIDEIAGTFVNLPRRGARDDDDDDDDDDDAVSRGPSP